VYWIRAGSPVQANRGRLGAGQKKLGHHHHRVEARDPRADEIRDAFGPREGDEQARLRVAQNPDLALRVLLDPVETKRRVQRNRHPTSKQGAEEGREEVLLGSEHEGHRVAALQASLAKTGGDT